jgi:catechol 2,3-dioxygenase-like lactoylglutathione lyase family enzyme
MQVKGIVFVGTHTAARHEMARFVREVLGLTSVPVDGTEADFFDLPNGTTFAVTTSDGAHPAERTVGFLVDDLEQAAEELNAAGITTDAVSTTGRQRYVHFRGPDGRLTSWWKTWPPGRRGLDVLSARLIRGWLGIDRPVALRPPLRRTATRRSTMVNTPGSGRATARSGARTQVQMAALAVGAVFLLVGVLGFIPGITTNYDAMEFAGHESGAKLLGVFQVSILHNIVHLLFGVAGLLLARTISGARAYLIGGGAIYLVLWLYGMLIDHESSANFVPVNRADDWLHLLLGLGMIAAGLLAEPRRPARR